MNDKIDSAIKLAPVLIIFIYATGFIAIYAYLNGIGITENISLDLNLLRVGALFLVVSLPPAAIMIGSFNFSENVDFNKEIENMVQANVQIMSFIFLFSIVLYGFKWDIGVGVLLFLFIIHLIILRLIPNKYRLFPNMSMTVLPMFISLFLLTEFPDEPRLWFLFYIFFLTSLCALNRIYYIKGRVLAIARVSTVCVGIIMSAVIFGNVILKDVSYALGGELRKTQNYIFTEKGYKQLIDLPISPCISQKRRATLQPIYESNSHFFFKVTKNVTLKIPKSYIEIEEISSVSSNHH